MSLELIKESVMVNRVIGEDTAQTIVENDIIVPDVKPDIARILLLDGDIYVNGTEALQDRVLVNGTINYKILYVSDDPEQPVKSINTGSGFSYALDVPNTRQGMKSRVKCDIEHIEYEVLNSRKVSVKTIVNVKGTVREEVDQGVVCGFDGVEGVQLLRSTISVNSYIGSSEVDCPVREMLELPAGKPTIREILRNDIRITGKDYKLAENKVIAKGELNVSTLYVGDDENRSIQYMEHEMPFTQFIDLQGLGEDSVCEVEYRIADAAFTAEEDSDGELRQLRGEVSLNVFAEASGKKEVGLVQDAYSPAVRLTLEKEPLEMDEFVAEGRGQVTLKETIEIDEGSPDIAEVFNVLSKPVVSGYKIEDDRIFLEGVLDSSILYLANNAEQPVFCCSREIPFRHSMDVKGANPEMKSSIDMNMEHCSYSMVSSKEIEIRFVISVTTRVIKKVTFPVIAKVMESSLDEKRAAAQPSIIIYFAQQGDDLWSIAKRYSTTIDEIKRANSISGADTLGIGEQIIIPRKI